jgi:hypothetical protein
MTTETSTDAMQEANVFFKDENGFRWHFKLQAPNQMALQAAHRRAVDFLLASGYTPDSGPSHGNAPAGAQQAAAAPKPEAVLCGFCGGATWDNRTNKRNPKGPDYTCKDKEECGGRAWLKNDGSLGEWKMPAL